ncbi:MAG: MlaD family protein [Treponema sp.]|jgi:phospholipid/cholesterol/gamma-HCH transport system substrate-binding protein|nr:MlaD family protein [Treponema sp.]
MKGSQYVKVAFFFIILGAAGGAYVIMSSDGVNQFNSKTYETVIEDATGLSANSKIYLAGVPVGKIQSIDLQGGAALLKLAFLKDINVHADARISRRASSILGTSILALEPGTELSPLIPPGGRIESDKRTADMNAVMGVVEELGTQISGILAEFQSNQMALLAVSLETFNSIAGKIDAQMDGELARISRILESVALISERTERIMADQEGDIRGSISDIRGALNNIRLITDQIQTGRGNVGQVIYDDRFYDSLLSTMEKLQTTLDSINTVAVDADEVVKKITGLGIQVDTRALYEMRSERVRAGASLRLEPGTNDRWYRIGVTGVPDGVSSRTVKETTAGGVTTREDTTETDYSLGIDAELARRFGPITVRGGLLESTAGLGLDVQPLKWASISGEVFNFKSGEKPNFRGSLTFYPFFDPDGDKPWNWIYLQGGVSHILDGSRDYFIGGGVRFADREVKGLVGLLPAVSGSGL